MQLQLPDGANINASEVERINAALEALAKDPHSPHEITITVALFVYREYPKHIGDKIVNSAVEEAALQGAI